MKRLIESFINLVDQHSGNKKKQERYFPNIQMFASLKAKYFLICFIVLKRIYFLLKLKGIRKRAINPLPLS